MTTLDLLYVALFAVAFPLGDYLVFWPGHFIASHKPIRLGPGRGSGNRRSERTKGFTKQSKHS